MTKYAVKHILGHEDIQTTMRYAHLSPDYLKEAVNQGSLPETGSDRLDAYTALEEYRSNILINLKTNLAGGLGFEPRFSDPKSESNDE